MRFAGELREAPEVRDHLSRLEKTVITWVMTKTEVMKKKGEKEEEEEEEEETASEIFLLPPVDVWVSPKKYRNVGLLPALFALENLDIVATFAWLRHSRRSVSGSPEECRKIRFNERRLRAWFSFFLVRQRIQFIRQLEGL